jgi:hypothetical protein
MPGTFTDPLLAEAWPLATTAGFTAEGERTPAQRDALALAAGLTAELTSADAILLAVPLYNCGVSQHFKTWIDLVIAGAGPAAANRLLKDKPAALVTVYGGGYGPGTPARAGTTPRPTSGESSVICGRPTSPSSNANFPSPPPPPGWKASGTWPPNGMPGPGTPPGTRAAPWPSDTITDRNGPWSAAARRAVLAGRRRHRPSVRGLRRQSCVRNYVREVCALSAA